MSEHESVSGICEAKLVERVFASPRTRSHVLNCHGFPTDPAWRLKELLRGLGDGKGDVDILAWTPRRPERALAIEAKRFKTVLAGDDGDVVSKLHEFDKAVTQANRMADIGFALVYIVVFVLVDSRPQNAEAINSGSHIYDGLTAELNSRVRAALNTRDLDRRIGVMTVEYLQSMDDTPVYGLGSTHVQLHQPHVEVAQPEAVTEWIKELPVNPEIP